MGGARLHCIPKVFKITIGFFKKFNAFYRVLQPSILLEEVCHKKLIQSQLLQQSFSSVNETSSIYRKQGRFSYRVLNFIRKFFFGNYHFYVISKLTTTTWFVRRYQRRVFCFSFTQSVTKLMINFLNYFTIESDSVFRTSHKLHPDSPGCHHTVVVCL